MKYLEYLKAILESNLFSAFIGSITGGIVTWIVTKNSLKKQFEYQNRLVEVEQKRKEKIALRSIRSEILYNLIYLNGSKKIFDKENMQYINFKESKSNIMLKKDSWEKHSDIIESIEFLDYIGKLQGFYITISSEIMCQATNVERTTRLIKDGHKLLELLDNTIKLYG
ncbi:hypothetical protein [Clostridium sporogenes]|uniref:Uncharacterized protein n=1 Tax=Clostridium sporogenes TaxID=1509 RepID=A0AAE6I659_CLOSG|nr:hypothetical protein [Clostridium sporogenes]QDY32678.1 hypothetical protein CGS26_10045 [Clostridium sporogenes]